VAKKQQETFAGIVVTQLILYTKKIN
jgi:hypothetical protein